MESSYMSSWIFQEPSSPIFSMMFMFGSDSSVLWSYNLPFQNSLCGGWNNYNGYSGAPHGRTFRSDGWRTYGNRGVGKGYQFRFHFWSYIWSMNVLAWWHFFWVSGGCSAWIRSCPSGIGSGTFSGAHNPRSVHVGWLQPTYQWGEGIVQICCKYEHSKLYQNSLTVGRGPIQHIHVQVVWILYAIIIIHNIQCNVYIQLYVYIYMCVCV